MNRNCDNAFHLMHDHGFRIKVPGIGNSFDAPDPPIHNLIAHSQDVGKL